METKEPGKETEEKATDLIRTLEGHGGPVLSVAVFPDGARALSGGQDGTVRLWDLESGRCTKTLEGHGSWVRSVAVLSDGVRALSAGEDGTVRLWDLKTGRCTKTLEGHRGPIWSVTVLSDGARALSGGSDGTVRLWDLESGRCAKTLEGHRGRVWSVAVFPDGARALSAGDDGTVRLWDLETGRCTKTLEGHGGWVRSVAVLSGGARALSAGEDGTVRLWNLESGRCTKTLESHRGTVLLVAVLSDGARALSAGSDGRVRLWDLERGWCTKTLEGHRGRVWSAAVLSDDARALSAGEDGFICVWDLKGVGVPERPPERMVQYASAKVALVGDENVGKTWLGMRLAENRIPSEKERGTTHGMRLWRLKPEQLALTASLPSDMHREIILWDMGGQREYRLVHQLFLHDTTVACLLIDPKRTEKSLERAAEWDRALKKQFGERKTVKFLVGAQMDEPSGLVDEGAIRKFCEDFGYRLYIETSAVEGRGLDELRRALGEALDWENLCRGTRLEIFQKVRDEVARRQDRGEVVITLDELTESVIDEEGYPAKKKKERREAEENVRFTVGQLAQQGMVADTRLATGERALVLQIGRVEEYAGSLIVMARNNDRGVPVIEERVLGLSMLSLPGMKKRIKPRLQERAVLECVTELLIEHGICFRHEGMLIFPSLFPSGDGAEDEKIGHTVSLYYDFSGAIDNIYASLVAWLVIGGQFGKVRLWPSRAEFEEPGKGICGVRKIARRRGFPHMDVYFDDTTDEKRRRFFIRFVEDHLRDHGVDIQEHIAITCKCGKEIDEDTIRIRIQRGDRDVVCSICEKRTLISEGARAERDYDTEQRILALKREIERKAQAEAEEAKRVFVVSDKDQKPTGPIRVLHLSDLHFTKDTDPETRLQFLVDDIQKDLKIEKLDYCVISGDFTHKGSEEGLDRAGDFISMLIERFSLTAHRCVFAPGNHDLQHLYGMYFVEPGPDDTEQKVRRDEVFAKRFDQFSRKIWHQYMTKPYPQDFKQQGIAYLYDDDHFLFLTLNSAAEIDQFNKAKSGISPDAMAQALREADRLVKDKKKRLREHKTLGEKVLRFCVFHHSVGRIKPMENLDFIGHLQKHDVKVCMHGDVHAYNRDLIGYWHEKQMHVVGAGSFGSEAEGRPESEPRLYNLLEVDRENFDWIKVHTRQQKKADGAWEGWHEWPDERGGEGKFPYYTIPLQW